MSNSVTASSRKNLIWDALQETQGELDAIKSSSSADEAKNARRLQLEDETGNLSTDKVIDETAKVKSSFASAFSDISNQLEASVTQLSDVQEMIGVKDKELKEIYKIERSVNSLEALAKTQEDQTRSFDAEMAVKRQVWQKEVQDRNQKWQREEQDRTYEFDRKMMIESNQLNDNLAQERKTAEAEVTGRFAEAAAKENEVAEAISRASELEADMNSMTESHAVEVESAAAAATKSANSAAHFKNSMTEKDLNNQIQMLQNNATGLDKQVAEKDRTIADLHNRLSAANTQLQTVAVASLGAEALEKSNNALAGALDSSGKKK